MSQVPLVLVSDNGPGSDFYDFGFCTDALDLRALAAAGADLTAVPLSFHDRAGDVVGTLTVSVCAVAALRSAMAEA